MGINFSIAGEATRQLGIFAAALSYEDIPEAVVERAKLGILDTLGCCLFGTTLDSTRAVIEMVLEEGCSQQASIMGTSYRTAAPSAALVNSTAAHAFELDEIHVAATLHPGSLSLPVALALAEWKGGVSGRDFLAAMIAGYEVGLRVGIATDGRMFVRGYHNQGTSGVLVAAATAARLLRLNPDESHHALALAASQAAGLMAAQEGANAKGLHCGRAAQSGIYAALLARRGFTGIPNALEAPYGGFFSTMTDRARMELLTENLGKRWETLSVAFKPYATAGSSHTAMDMLDSIMKEHALVAEDIADVHVACGSNSYDHCAWEYNPDKVQGVLTAQMNMYYAIAVMALDRAAMVDQFRDDRLRDPGILNFIKRIHIEVDRKFDDLGTAFRHATRMTLRTCDGRVFEREALHRRGSPENPMTGDALHSKFTELAHYVLPKETIDCVINCVGDLEHLDNMQDLSGLLLLPAGSRMAKAGKGE